MKRVTLEATDENILNSISNNTYSRNDDVKDFIEALDAIEGNMFISLDGRWGEGKSFYIRQVELALKYLVQKKWENDKERVLAPYFQNPIWKDIDLKHSCFPVYYNAWYYDNHDDPLLSLLYVILKQYSGFVDTKKDQATLKQKFLSLLSGFSVSLNGIGSISVEPKKIYEDLKGKDIFEEILLVEEIRDKVKEIFDQMITENAERLVIIVDELDRCRPSYAVEVLERIKHYFDDDRIIFIAAVNKEQLVHILKNYYGDSFDSTGYLNKFFDYNVYMPTLKTVCVNKINWNLTNRQYYLSYISEELADYFKLTLRDYLIYGERINQLPEKYVNDGANNQFYLTLFVPILIILDMKNQDDKERFLRGDVEVFEKYCTRLQSIKNHICRMQKTAYRNEDDTEHFKDCYEKVKSVYEVVFGDADENKLYQEHKLEISSNLRELCMKLCNGFLKE